MDDADVEVCDVEHDAFPFVLSADHDVAEECSVAQCDASCGVDAVGADTECGGWLCGAWLGFGACGECLVWGDVSAGAVWAVVVVVVDDHIELLLKFGDCRGGWLFSESEFQGLVEAFDFAAGLWVVGA